MANRGAVPLTGLMETSLPRRSGNGILVVVIPSCKTRLKRQKHFMLTNPRPIMPSTSVKPMSERQWLADQERLQP